MIRLTDKALIENHQISLLETFQTPSSVQNMIHQIGRSKKVAPVLLQMMMRAIGHGSDFVPAVDYTRCVSESICEIMRTTCE